MGISSKDRWPGSILSEVVVGASGTTAFFDKFKRHIKIQTEQNEAQKEDNSAPYENIEQFITVCERISRDIKTEYGILRKIQNPIELLISINTGDVMPTLHHLNTSEQVAEEEIHRYLVIGHGELMLPYLWKNYGIYEWIWNNPLYLHVRFLRLLIKNI